MTRGGKRPGAGRPNTWKTPGSSKMIRIPGDLVEEVLSFARELDRMKNLSKPDIPHGQEP